MGFPRHQPWMSESRESCCLPGDITITQVFSGWMIGRALEQIGPGPWWAFIRIVPDYDTAVREAAVLARASGVRAWLHKGGEDYEPIAVDDGAGGPSEN
jgi:hypothetical protein